MNAEFSPDGKRFFVAGCYSRTRRLVPAGKKACPTWRSSIVVWDLASGTRRKLADDWSNSHAFTPDGKTAAVEVDEFEVEAERFICSI